MRKRYVELGIIVKIKITTPDGMTVEKPGNAADVLNLRDGSGKPSVDMAKQMIEMEKLNIAQTIFVLTKALLVDMGKTDLIWTDETEKMNWENHKELFYYCETMLLKTKVISRHDNMWIAVVNTHDDIEMASKIITPEDMEEIQEHYNPQKKEENKNGK